MTWVHSQSGIRLPIRAIADMIADVNRNRAQRVLLVVDGVHGLGVEDPAIVNLGADAFAAGLHKWIFAPRGTGFVWAKPDVWASMRPLIPSFTSFELFDAFNSGKPPAGIPRANWFTPGGFQAFEHWWSIPAALDFHYAIGSGRITQRIHALNQHMNVELRKLPNVKIAYTPTDPQLNAGMVCFDMKNFVAQKTVSKLLREKGHRFDDAVCGAVRAGGVRNHEHVRRGGTNGGGGAFAGVMRNVILSRGDGEGSLRRRSFAALRMTIITSLLFACASVPVMTPDSEQMLPPDVEAISLLGKPLSSPPLPADVQKKREEELAQAQRDYDANPNNADAIIWLGRRNAYLGHYREAINIFTEGIRKHPDDARMYRHRGHRYITVRRFRDAVRDLEFAALLVRGKPDEVEPDGQPNARNIPLGSLQSNIFYHLGLAYYLLGDDDHALTAYRQCLDRAKNPDRLVSASHWTYMTLRRLGRIKEADKVLEPISIDLDVIENISYHKLLLMYGGEIAPEELIKQDANTTDGATILYGIGNWYFYNGQSDRAKALWQKVLDGQQWAAFGYIAAEADVARSSPGPARRDHPSP